LATNLQKIESSKGDVLSDGSRFAAADLADGVRAHGVGRTEFPPVSGATGGFVAWNGRIGVEAGAFIWYNERVCKE